MPDKEKKEDSLSSPLRPRFSIEKRKISGKKTDEESSTAFTPEKILYCEIDDEITLVFDRIKQVRANDIALVIPRKAIVLQSLINLRILKKKIDELGKNILIVTSDPAGLQNAEKSGIPAVEKLFDTKLIGKHENEKTPLRGERPVRMNGTRVSIAEVIGTPGKPHLVSTLFQKFKEHLKKKKRDASNTRLVFIAPNKQALFTLILVSVLLFLAIAYIALPGATIHLTPKATVLDPTFNITFLDYEKNRDAIDSNRAASITVASYPVEAPPFTTKVSHNSTGKIFKGTDARGIITIINKSPTPWDLAARTRFQTLEGLVFRTPAAVRVPASVGTTAGTLDVPVVADQFDANNQVIGDRGNIPPSTFFLPGIKNEENRQKIYGESKNPMTGGVSKSTKVVTQEDVDAAKQDLTRAVAKEAAMTLKNYIEEQNLAKKTNLTLLTDKNTLKVGEPTINIPPDLVGKEIDQFELTASFTIYGIAYKRDELMSALRNRLITRVDPDKKLVKISEDYLSYHFLEMDEDAGRVRLTATMRAIQEYDLDPERENGKRFIKKIADHIVGLRIEAAKEYLQQQTDEIAHVEISTWPIWAPTIPTIADNIKFVIDENEEVQ